MVIGNLDLSSALASLRQQGPNWTEDKLRQAEEQYRGFLNRASLSPEVYVAPTPLAALLWQAHVGQR